MLPLKQFDLRLSSSRLSRIFLLVVCLFDTFAAARPTGQELGPSRLLTDDNLLLQIHNTQAGTVPCLQLMQLSKTFCPDLSTPMTEPHETFPLGRMRFETSKMNAVIEIMNTVTTLFSVTLAGSTTITEDQDKRKAVWEHTTGTLDKLVKSRIFKHEEEAMRAWERTLLKETSTEVIVECLYLQNGKRSGDLRLIIGQQAITFAARDSEHNNLHHDTSKSADRQYSELPRKRLFSAKVCFRDEASITKALHTLQKVSTSPEYTAPWFTQVLRNEKLTKETMPFAAFPWNQIDTAMRFLRQHVDFGFVYAAGAKAMAQRSLKREDWEEVAVEGLTVILRQQAAVSGEGSAGEPARVSGERVQETNERGAKRQRVS
ncbi:hypothetical protein FB446DRAFT_724354, partial [Lentinula raphanica]